MHNPMILKTEPAWATMSEVNGQTFRVGMCEIFVFLVVLLHSHTPCLQKQTKNKQTQV